ncbi:hypothetical protein DYD21_19325 [Rhodohalobacter sp. SW132]|uniref:hypothetical protein n=1 Tax=Rhodohalobacter sp. SW132 TaxID=2293433 RepID=UPI000E266313|nr:hypothetical protein [Rhodohalobacter sp. SW132]REL24134.1 hypothetical protein DYD21_19325 [Rhodohalobacter sp. SW132]
MRDFFILLFIFWITTLFLPWYALLIPAILFGAVLFYKSLRAFFTGFLAGATAWGVQVIYIDIMNASILSNRIAEMLGAGSSWLVLLITALIGGLVCGCGTLLGNRFRILFQPKNRPQSAT